MIKIKKNTLIGIALFVSIIMTTVVHAAFSTQLQIKGDAIVRSDNDIRVTNFNVKTLDSGSYETYSSKYTKETISMFATLPSNSSITYTVEITNKSDSDYEIKELSEYSNSNANVNYEIVDYTIPNSVKKNSSQTFDIKLSNTTSEEQKITLTLKFTFKELIYTCKRAVTLHSESCSNDFSSDVYFCVHAGYELGNKITYGNLGTEGTLNTGDAFDCDVNGDGIYSADTERFYYVSEYYDAENAQFLSDYAVLIYYSNVDSNGNPDNTATQNYSTADGLLEGPTMAATNMPKTTLWTNVSLINEKRKILFVTGSDEYNGGTITNPFDYSGYAARLLTFQELEKAIGTYPITDYVLDDYEFFMENSSYALPYSDIIYNAYWIENMRYASDAYEGASIWHGKRRVSSGKGTIFRGVRPVIELYKYKLEV